MRMRVLGCWVLVLAAICPQSVSAQAFLAARPKPAFEVGPLLITATVTDAIAPRTPIRIVWGIVPSSGADSGLGEDLYLLWPGQISGTDASPAEPGLVSAVEGPGTRVTASGRLSLSSRSAVTLGSGTRAEAAPSGAPFVSFERKSNTTERVNVGSLIRIPWDPKFGERDRLMILEMNAHNQVRQHRSTWISELFFGRRYDVALSFNNVRVPPLFALYLREREHEESRDRLAGAQPLRWPGAPDPAGPLRVLQRALGGSPGGVHGGTLRPRPPRRAARRDAGETSTGIRRRPPPLRQETRANGAEYRRHPVQRGSRPHHAR